MVARLLDFRNSPAGQYLQFFGHAIGKQSVKGQVDPSLSSPFAGKSPLEGSKTSIACFSCR